MSYLENTGSIAEILFLNDGFLFLLIPRAWVEVKQASF